MAFSGVLRRMIGLSEEDAKKIKLWLSRASKKELDKVNAEIAKDLHDAIEEEFKKQEQK